MRPVVPGQGEFPGEVVGVLEALVEALRAERPEAVRRVPGEKDPAGAPAAGQPVVHGVDSGVEEFVRRCRAARPAGQGLPDAGHKEFGSDQVLARRQQPVQAPHALGERAGGDLPGGRAGRPPRRHPVQQRPVLPGEFRAQGGDRVALDRRTAREADVLELAHGGTRAVAADQVTAAPPGAFGAAGVGGDARGLLLDRVQTAVGDELDQSLLGQGGAQGAGQDVLREVQGRLRPPRSRPRASPACGASTAIRPSAHRARRPALRSAAT